MGFRAWLRHFTREPPLGARLFARGYSPDGPQKRPEDCRGHRRPGADYAWRRMHPPPLGARMFCSGRPRRPDGGLPSLALSILFAQGLRPYGGETAYPTGVVGLRSAPGLRLERRGCIASRLHASTATRCQKGELVAYFGSLAVWRGRGGVRGRGRRGCGCRCSRWGCRREQLGGQLQWR